MGTRSSEYNDHQRSVSILRNFRQQDRSKTEGQVNNKDHPVIEGILIGSLSKEEEEKKDGRRRKLDKEGEDTTTDPFEVQSSLVHELVYYARRSG